MTAETFAEVLKAGSSRLRQGRIPDAVSDARRLMCHATGADSAQLIGISEMGVELGARKRFDDAVEEPVHPLFDLGDLTLAR